MSILFTIGNIGLIKILNLSDTYIIEILNNILPNNINDNDDMCNNDILEIIIYLHGRNIQCYNYIKMFKNNELIMDYVINVLNYDPSKFICFSNKCSNVTYFHVLCKIIKNKQLLKNVILNNIVHFFDILIFCDLQKININKYDIIDKLLSNKLFLQVMCLKNNFINIFDKYNFTKKDFSYEFNEIIMNYLQSLYKQYKKCKYFYDSDDYYDDNYDDNDDTHLESLLKYLHDNNLISPKWSKFRYLLSKFDLISSHNICSDDKSYELCKSRYRKK